MDGLQLLAVIGKFVLAVAIKGLLLSMPITAQYHPPPEQYQCQTATADMQALTE